jgi:hypothetical protein
MQKKEKGNKKEKGRRGKTRQEKRMMRDETRG